MNEARVDRPSTPGSSSVDAYEEDWYRSLRALAERRRNELDQFEDEPEESPEKSQESGRPEASERSEESAPADKSERSEAEAPPEIAPSPWAPPLEAPSASVPVAEMPDAPAPAEIPGSPPGTRSAAATTSDVWATPSEPAEAERPQLPRIPRPSAGGFATGPSTAEETSPTPAMGAPADAQPAPTEPDAPTAESSTVEPPTVETAGEPSTVETAGEPSTVESTAELSTVETAGESSAAEDTAPGSEESAAETSWARILRPLKRIQAPSQPTDEPTEPGADGAAAAGASAEGLEQAAAAPGSEQPPDREIDRGVHEAPAASAAVAPEPEPEPTGPSLSSRDPAERRAALLAVMEHEPTAAELETVAALVLDPDAELRRLAVEALSRTRVRLDDAVIRQTLQDPADEVRAAAVHAAATRGVRDLPALAPLVDARRWPETHRTVLTLLPKILGEAQLTADALDPLLLAIAQMQLPPDEQERAAFTEIAASIGTMLLIQGLTLPDARRLGAVRLLTGDRSPAVLNALAQRAGDPLEEVRQAGLAAADEIARIEAEAARAAGPPDIAGLAQELRDPDPGHVERAVAALAAVDRSDVVSWCRERLEQADPDSVAMVASVVTVLDLNDVVADLLTCGAALPSERRRPVIEALAEFRDPSRLAGALTVVPSETRADAVRLVWEASGRRVLPELRGFLADPAVEVRVAVIEIARDADDPASIEAVAALLAAEASADVRAAAVRTIATAEDGLPKVVAALGDPDPHVRATAVESMPSTPASEVGPILAQALSDPDERVRLAAIERLAGVSSRDPALAWSALLRCRVEDRDELLAALQRTNPGQILEIALEHLTSLDEGERRLAIEMTGWGDSQGAVEAAIRALGDPLPDVRRTAVAALGRLRDRSAVAALGKALADPDVGVRVGAVRALGVIDDEGVLAFLVAALKDPDQEVRETTSHVLTEWSSPAVAKRLAGVLAVPSLRDSAADLLRRIGPTSVELLIDVLLQGNADLRPTVGPLLEQIIGVDEFLGRLDSLAPERRLRAIEALGAIAGPLAVDALVRSLSDPDERIRLRSTQLLGELGDPIATDAVRRLVDDPVAEVAAAARQALETNLGTRRLGREAGQPDAG
ncbi:MAG TPA: HEAT repeat domain-containing protein [Actinomycetota bacterium]